MIRSGSRVSRRVTSGDSSGARAPCDAGLRSPRIANPAQSVSIHAAGDLAHHSRRRAAGFIVAPRHCALVRPPSTPACIVRWTTTRVRHARPDGSTPRDMALQSTIKGRPPSKTHWPQCAFDGRPDRRAGRMTFWICHRPAWAPRIKRAWPLSRSSKAGKLGRPTPGFASSPGARQPPSANRRPLWSS